MAAEKAPKKVDKDALRTQGEKVAKMLRTRDTLRGDALEAKVAKYRTKLIAKRKEAEENIAKEVATLHQLAKS